MPSFLRPSSPSGFEPGLAIEPCADADCRPVAIELSSEGDGLEDDVFEVSQS
jgi:hypothetical protein